MKFLAVIFLYSLVASSELWADSSRDNVSNNVIRLEPILVTPSPLVTSKDELVVPASELSGNALQRNAQSSLGATLDGLPGVHSTYFGPGAGRPVIRGFSGDRVRILNQGTDSFDVSQASPDHGVSIEPLFARAIEIVRGPASLLYGNAAIGGVVNVIGKELPRQPAYAPIYGQAETSFGTVADEFQAGISLEGGTAKFAWSFGFLDRNSNDLEIPGFAESVYRIAEEEEDEPENEETEEHEEHEEAFGVLENSFVQTQSHYLGMGWFSDKASLAISFSSYNTEYGVPGHAHEEEEDGDKEEHEEESVSIDLDQSRFSLRGELLEPTDFLESVELQFGYGDYNHMELEGQEIGTIFNRDGYELRLTGVHRPFGDLTGAVGLQIKDESFSAIGEEAFIPSNGLANYGLFIVERLTREWGAWELGGRLETVKVDPDDAILKERRFTTGNASAGFFRRVSDVAAISANLTYAERAPNASELLAFGPHIGTKSFEIGDVSLGKESSTNLDISYRLTAGKVTGELTAFYSDFSDFIYLQFLDRESAENAHGELDTEGLNIFRANATDAQFYGFEVDLRFRIIDETDRAAHFDLLVDQTRATNRRFNSNLPRIPTRRIGGRYEYEAGPWLLGIEGRWHDSASHLAPNELPSDSYFLWGADARYRFQETDSVTIDLFAVGTNLGDEEARPHTSFLKGIAPMPGRSIKFGLLTSF